MTAVILERNGRKLRSLTEDELYNSVVDIVSEIKLMTGAIVFEDKDDMKLQVSMITKFLAIGFSMLSKEEIVHAFYLNNMGKYDETFRHYNRELNAEFMGDVLKSYLKYKGYIREVRGADITRLLGNTAELPAPPTKPDYELWKEMIQAEYDYFRENEQTNQIWHARKYITLRRMGLIPFKGLQTWYYFMKAAIGTRRGWINLPDGVNLKSYKFGSVGEVYRLFTSPEAFKLCVDESRRFAYWYVINAMAECGINKIFEEIAPE